VPPAIDPPTNLSGALKTDLGDGLRRCFDKGTAANVRCSDSHTAEYIALPAGAASSLDACVDASGRYLGSPLSANAASLTVRTVEPVGSDDRRICLLEVIGNRHLTSSLRLIGYSSIPWTD